MLVYFYLIATKTGFKTTVSLLFKYLLSIYLLEYYLLIENVVISYRYFCLFKLMFVFPCLLGSCLIRDLTLLRRVAGGKVLSALKAKKLTVSIPYLILSLASVDNTNQMGTSKGGLPCFRVRGTRVVWTTVCYTRCFS